MDAPGQWVVHARVGSYNLYTQSFLSVLLDKGWVSDEVSTDPRMFAISIYGNFLNLKDYYLLFQSHTEATEAGTYVYN